MKKRLKFGKGERTFYVSLCKGSIFTNILIYESQKILGIPFSHLVSVETTAELIMQAESQNIYFDKNADSYLFDLCNFAIDTYLWDEKIENKKRKNEEKQLEYLKTKCS
mgnify:CR=1 FL=1